MKKYLALTVAAAAALVSHSAVAALAAGDLAFTSLNADEDGWSLVALADIDANSTIYFTDNEWNGTSFNTGESYHRWVSGAATIAAGTVIRFQNIDDATSLSATFGTLSRASVSGSSNFGLSASEDSIYAFTGATSSGLLTNTGLSIGNGAIALGGGAEYEEYIGSRSGAASFAAYKAQVGDIANWTNNAKNGNYATMVPDTTAFAVTAVPEPQTYALMLSGLMAVGFMARRRKG